MESRPQAQLAAVTVYMLASLHVVLLLASLHALVIILRQSCRMRAPGH